MSASPPDARSPEAGSPDTAFSDLTPRARLLTHRVDEPRSGTDAAPTILLLNGGFMTAASWEPIATPLLERHRLVRCDFRGQLTSPGPVHERFEGNVDDIGVLLDHLEETHGIERVHVVGTSFGGKAAVLLAARRPERVESLVVVTAADRATDAMFRGAEEMHRVVDSILAGGDRTAFHDLLVRDVYSTAHVEANADVLAERGRQIGRFPDAWFAATKDLVRSLEPLDLRPALPSIRCPTLVVVAGDDRVTLPERGRALARGIDGARIVEHPTSGHALVAEDPAWVAATILEFLDSLR